MGDGVGGIVCGYVIYKGLIRGINFSLVRKIKRILFGEMVYLREFLLFRYI